ncbi:MAG: nucleotidyltransferase family protein [Halanaerobiales bacterium]|nr:nucleotidyltransferase family protein [Halanaerobiales bacterium]
MEKRKDNAYNLDLQSQIQILQEVLFENEVLREVLNRSSSLEVESYYVGAGCITQTVWNYLSGNQLNYGIQDIDFVYFDKVDLSYANEDKIVKKAYRLFADIPLKIDVKNQARVHLWYKKHFRYEIKPYSSLEDAINSWPTTATSIGVRLDARGNLIVYAPFGLNDLFGKFVRANKVQITKEIYEQKVFRWLSIWPDLKIIPWG